MQWVVSYRVRPVAGSLYRQPTGQAVTQGVMPLAHKMTLYIAKSLAAMGAELMVNAELLERAKQEHRRLVGPEGYVCPIPKGVKPRAMDSLHK